MAKELLDIDSDQIVRKEDGYFNATYICAIGDRKFSKWHEMLQTKQLKAVCERLTGISSADLIKIAHGGDYRKKEQGAWIHRYLVPHLAMWISYTFAVKLSIWIDEWRNLNEQNNDIFINELQNIKCDRHNRKIEYTIQQRLAAELDGECEVPTEVGFIDILTQSEVIEIKSMSRWLHAVGQIQGYYTFLNNKSLIMRIHLFYFNTSELDKMPLIEKLCNKYDIKVTIEQADIA